MNKPSGTQHRFPSNDDFELSKSGSTRECQYSIYNASPKNGLVVYIPGFGADLGEYTEKFCQKVAHRHNTSTMHVQYFAHASRPHLGAKIKFNDVEAQALNQLLKRLGANPTTDTNENLALLHSLTSQVEKQVTVTASLMPPLGHYQNFGVLPALDILNAIHNAVEKFDLDANNIILIGSSYGGYIANLITKFSPGTIRAVFDNSSWANPNLSYVVGRELGGGEYSVMMSKYIRLGLNVVSPWTLTPGLPNSFDKSRREIRSFSEQQIKKMASLGARESTQYYFYHGEKDSTAPTQEKVAMYNAMQKYGINADMSIISPGDVDGHFIKDMSHGLGMSMMTLFDKCYAKLLDNQKTFTSTKPNKVAYEFEDYTYQFDLSKTPIQAICI